MPGSSIRVHDLRGREVALNRANGRLSAWMFRRILGVCSIQVGTDEAHKPRCVSKWCADS